MKEGVKDMCPVCIATAALIAGSASAGGLAAVAIKNFGAKRTESRDRERTDDELSLGRGGHRPLAG